MKHDINNQASALETTRGFYIVSEFHEVWSTNGFKLDRSFYPPSVFYCVASPSHSLSGIYVAPHGEFI